MSDDLLKSIEHSHFNQTGLHHLEKDHHEVRQPYLEKALRRLERLKSRLQADSRKLSLSRIFTFGISLALFIALSEFQQWNLAITQLFFSSLGFIFLVKRHQKVKRQLRRCLRSINSKQIDVARLQIDWAKIPKIPLGSPIKDHPFEIDLDISGEYSIFRLIHHCFTQEGSSRLKSWLLETVPQAKQVQDRQNCVKALKGHYAFRNELDLAVGEAAYQYRHGGEEAWQSSEVLDVLKNLPARKVVATLALLSGLSASTFCLFLMAQNSFISPRLWQFSLTLYIVAFWFQRDKVSHLFKESHRLQYQLYRLQEVFAVLEKYAPSRDKKIQLLLKPFLAAERPSINIKKLGRIVAGASLQGNPLLWAGVNLLVPWDFYFAWRLESLKPQLQKQLPQWLESLWELEALNALAHFAWLHPERSFPNLNNDKPIFQARTLGHPLLPPQHKVCNDFQFQNLGEAILLTGSNMAGKSTFLKSLGLNAVLAQAGSVVDAQSLQMPLLRLHCCIKVSDSVTDGISYFYAEVRRLKQILVAINEENPVPVMFLVDEIFKGTNNRERLIGSRSYLKELCGKHAFGGVSTHDLELVQLAEDTADLENYHFREHIYQQRMVFDYKIQKGPSPTTNALKIMAIEGLPIEETPR